MAETEGFELIGVFRDAGQSAHNLNRPGLINLLSVVESGRVDAVIIRDLSRLARNAQYLLRLLRLFKTQGVALISAVEPINTMSGTGRRY
jgi:DNA invertase Pin-like site-specific DNA recombinase